MSSIKQLHPSAMVVENLTETVFTDDWQEGEMT
jgi:hypothetical protein